jgi:hypothetical protein
LKKKTTGTNTRSNYGKSTDRKPQPHEDRQRNALSSIIKKKTKTRART